MKREGQKSFILYHKMRQKVKKKYILKWLVPDQVVVNQRKRHFGHLVTIPPIISIKFKPNMDKTWFRVKNKSIFKHNFQVQIIIKPCDIYDWWNLFSLILVIVSQYVCIDSNVLIHWSSPNWRRPITCCAEAGHLLNFCLKIKWTVVAVQFHCFT